MKIGVFDSGLGGLAIAHAIIDWLPDYDYLYLGDTKRVPYGNRSQETIHEFVAEALAYLFANDCQLIILACNTASAEALRKSQQEYLPIHYPERRVLGVLIPAAEAAAAIAQRSVGLIATASTVESRSYERELARLNPAIELVAKAAPLLVPLVENDGFRYIHPILKDYLAGLEDCEALILGCTHYCLLKDQVRELVSMPVISQDEVVPEKLAAYLQRHPEIESKLTRNRTRSYQVTDLTPSYRALARSMSTEDIELELTKI
jgi:glutamate racemase